MAELPTYEEALRIVGVEQIRRAAEEVRCRAHVSSLEGSAAGGTQMFERGPPDRERAIVVETQLHPEPVGPLEVIPDELVEF
jgi:hypothetical protein